MKKVVEFVGVWACMIVFLAGVIGLVVGGVTVFAMLGQFLEEHCRFPFPLAIITSAALTLSLPLSIACYFEEDINE